MEEPNPELEEARREIAEKARKHAEASVYSLNNPYLTQSEKLEVEMWFQLPGNFLTYAFFVTAVWSAFYTVPWSYIIIVPTAVGLITTFANWWYYNKRAVYALHLTLFHSFVQYSVGIVVAAFLFFRGLHVLAAAALLAPFGLAVLLEAPYMIIYSLLSTGYNMHPKYAFFKKHYGYVFPFEQGTLREEGGE